MVEIRPIVEEEFEAFTAANRAAFTEPQFRQHLLRSFAPDMEFGRTAAAFDGGDIVGTSAWYSYEMTLPGGALLPTAGLTWVGVLPTHRRRGLLRRLVDAHFADAHERGEAASLLYASEGLIYRRFGYEVAIPHEHWHIERAHTAFEYELEAPGRLRLLTREDAAARVPPIFDQARRQRPGMTGLPESSWRAYEFAIDPEGGEPWKRQYVVYERDGRDEGFAIYEAGAGAYEPADAHHRRTLNVHMEVSTSDEAHFAIWRYLFNIDLVSRIDSLNRPMDDPIPAMLADPRRLLRKVDDGSWLRILDVPAALRGRSYAGEGALVIEVHDPVCPWVAGRYRLEAGAGEARCERTEEAPDLVMDAATLAGPYLGGPSFGVFTRAGRVEERTAGAAERADALFRSDPGPWNAFMF